MADLNLFGEPEDSPVQPAPAKKSPVKPLESWQYYTLAQAAMLLKMSNDRAAALLKECGKEPVSPFQWEPLACYSRADVSEVVRLEAAKRQDDTWKHTCRDEGYSPFKAPCPGCMAQLSKNGASKK